MSRSLDVIGIKQTIRLEWIEMTSNLILAGMDEKTIRRELHDFLSTSTSNENSLARSKHSRTFVVNNLMRIWVAPETELVDMRDAALVMLRDDPSNSPIIHWAMISAAYPFWFNVSRQIGRLLNLQNQVTQKQIVDRLKEQYGDRETISRYTRYVIRSFVAWGVLKDSKFKGCYERTTPTIVPNQNLVFLLLEAALHTIPEGKGTLDQLLKSPAFFPFQLPMINSGLITQQTPRIEIARFGQNCDILKLVCHTSIPKIKGDQ